MNIEIEILIKVMLYSLDEFVLTPATVSTVEHRKDVNITRNNMLPLFTAPMSCIVDAENAELFINSGINTIIPRSVDFSTRLSFFQKGAWVAFGFKEAEIVYENLEIENGVVRICIDQANGHMQSLLDLCSKFKDKFDGHIEIMTGNVANPLTYIEYAKAGVDYIRLGIGGGNVCTTSVQTGIHFPMGSLIVECNKLRSKMLLSGNEYKSIPKIVADGGFKRIDQIVKAIALGADFVMLGEILARSEEACGEIISERNKYGYKEREYFGMSTEKAQEIVNNASFFKVEDFVPKHTEGQIKYVPVEYGIVDWLEDFTHALRSCMSYCNARNLSDFVGKVDYGNMTQTTLSAYMK